MGGSSADGKGKLAGVTEYSIFSIFLIKWLKHLSQSAAEVVETAAGAGFTKLLMALNTNLSPNTCFFDSNK